MADRDEKDWVDPDAVQVEEPEEPKQEYKKKYSNK